MKRRKIRERLRQDREYVAMQSKTVVNDQMPVDIQDDDFEELSLA